MQARFRTDRNEPALALNRVINQRIKELGESARDACVATMITVLRSLRAATKVAKLGRFRGTFVKMPQYIASYRMLGGKRVPCVRIGDEKSPSLDGVRVVALTKTWHGRADRPDVYMVNGSVGDKARKSFFILARSKAQAADWVRTWNEKRIKQYRGMAKFAIGIAQSKVSSRSQPFEGITGKAKAVALLNVNVKKQKAGNLYSIDVADTLGYASKALKGGEATVAIAEQRACNSIVGYINSTIKRSGSVRKPLKIPFPPGGIG